MKHLRYFVFLLVLTTRHGFALGRGPDLLAGPDDCLGTFCEDGGHGEASYDDYMNRVFGEDGFNKIPYAAGGLPNLDPHAGAGDFPGFPSGGPPIGDVPGSPSGGLEGFLSGGGLQRFPSGGILGLRTGGPPGLPFQRIPSGEIPFQSRRFPGLTSRGLTRFPMGGFGGAEAGGGAGLGPSFGGPAFTGPPSGSPFGEFALGRRR